MALELVLILLMLVANGVFAMAEIAVVSARKVRLQQAADAGDPGARAALELVRSPNRFLSTVQVGITLIGILAGAFGGATIAEKLEESLRPVPVVGRYSEVVGVAVVVLATTYLSLIMGELVPKRLALANPERIAARVARPMQSLAAAAAPVVSLLTASADLLFGLLGGKPSQAASISEEEITLLIEQGIHEGVFEQVDRDIIERVLRLDARRVASVMTPHTEIVWLDVEDTPEETRARILDSGHSTFPVGQGTLDRVLGIASVKSLWASAQQGQPLDLRASVQPPLYVPENASVLHLLRLFKESRQHMALVIDEHSNVEGIVTLMDVLEAIVGDIPSLAAPGEPEPIVQRDDRSWLVDGLLPIDEFKAAFDLEALPGEDEAAFQTVGGFVMAHLDRVPRVADAFEWGGLRFEVAAMDARRVDRVLVTRLSESRR